LETGVESDLSVRIQQISYVYVKNQRAWERCRVRTLFSIFMMF